MKTVTGDLEFIPEFDFKSICSPEEMLFFDIETTGLKKETTQLYLIGCAYYSDGCWKIRQWLAQNARDEEYILEDFFDLASGYRTLVHFNGDGFDIPYVKYKSDFYSISCPLDCMKSFDIYRHARVSKKLLNQSSMSQKSVEAFLGIERDDQYDGGRLIPVYYNYERSGDPYLEELLLLHNFDDLQGMIKILPILSYSSIFDGNYCFTGYEEHQNKLTVNYRLNDTIPRKCETYTASGNVQVYAENDLLQLNIDIFEGTARTFLENVSDYYYLPEEDTVIHKDVAQFADRGKRIRATRKNCYLKKEGKYISSCPSWNGKIFFRMDDKKNAMADIEDIIKGDTDNIFNDYARYILNTISS